MTERYVRPDVRALEGAGAGAPWDERVLAYARVVEVMRARGPEDPTSWIAQATLHAERPRGTWFLLPWLRMYLWFLERIMRAIVAEGGGPPDWSLPFWSHADGDATLPRAFRAPALPDGAANPLYRSDAERAPGMNAGAPLPAAVRSPDRALAARTFSPGFGGVPSGPRAADGEPAPPGLLELQPHDGVIAALGADAAFDPVFPLHLAQVDRLWEAWLRRGGGRANPVQFDWTDQVFAFVDADGRGRDLTCGQVGDLVNLDYAYAGLPLPARTERVLRAGADAAPVADWPGRGRPIAACAGDGVELGAEPRRVRLEPSSPGVAPAGSRVYLCLEDAEAAGVPGSVWEVRVERADGGDGSVRGAAVGTIAFPCRCPRRRFVLDVTDALDELGAGALAVSFHPALPAGFGLAAAPAARLGRVLLTDG